MRPARSSPLARAIHGAAVKVFADESLARPEPLGYHDDINRYWVDVLGCRPWKGEHGVPGQYELNEIALEHPFLLLFAATGPGKTYWLARFASWHLDNFEDSILIQVSSTWPQVERQFWAELRDCRKRAIRPKMLGRLNQTSLTIDDKWFGMGLSPADPTTIQGYHANVAIREEVRRARERWLSMTNAEYFELPDGEAPTQGSVRVIFDESSAIPDEHFDAAEGLMTGPNCGMVVSGNLNDTQGRFYRLWQANPPRWPNWIRFPEEPDHVAAVPPAAKADDPEEEVTEDEAEQRRLDWFSLRWTAFDAPVPGIRRWIHKMRKDCGPAYEKHPHYMVRVLAVPPEGAEGRVYPYGLLEACKDLRPVGGGKHIGVDLGFGGGDPCVATLFDNGRVTAACRWNVEGPVLDHVDTANVIRTLAKGDTYRGGTDRGWDVPDRNIHIDCSEAGGWAVWNTLANTCHMLTDPVVLGAKPVGEWNRILGRPPTLRNRRQELHWVALRLLQEGKLAIPDDPMTVRIRRDLEALRYAEGVYDEWRVELKKLYIAREGHSPDDGDSVIIGLSRVDPSTLRVRRIPARRRGRR